MNALDRIAGQIDVPPEEVPPPAPVPGAATIKGVSVTTWLYRIFDLVREGHHRRMLREGNHPERYTDTGNVMTPGYDLCQGCAPEGHSLYQRVLDSTRHQIHDQMILRDAHGLGYCPGCAWPLEPRAAA